MRAVSATYGVILTVLAGLSTGCLRKDVTHSIYIAPSGVVWSVIEKDVRSDATATADRLGEEHDYALAVTAGRHPVARAFRALGARTIATTWLRRDRPYTVMTEARFADLRDIALGLLRAANAPGEATIAAEGCDTVFHVSVNVDAVPEGSDDDALTALVEDLDKYRLVLTEGRFTAADGFVITDDGMTAVPDEHKALEDGVLTLSLRWRSGACSK